MNMKKSSTNRIIIEDCIKKFYIKASVSYDNNLDNGLPKQGLNFEVGDIMKVLNANDDIWWSAIKLDFTLDNPEQGEIGLIPSAVKLSKSKTSRDINVNFEKITKVIEPNGAVNESSLMLENGVPAFNHRANSSMSSLELKKKRLQGQEHKPIKDKMHHINFEPTDVYCIVEALPYPQTRPVIIIGPAHGYIYNSLVQRYPNKFVSPVNHTTRQKRENESDGIDYHFLESNSQFEEQKENGMFLETVQFRNNWYGTSMLAVKTVMQNRQHCILEATIGMISRLKDKDIEPISVLLCVQEFDDAVKICNMEQGQENNGNQGNNNSTVVSDSRERLIRKMMQQAISLYSSDRGIFNAVIWCKNPSEMVDQCINVIENCQRIGVWRKVSDQSQLISENYE